MAVPRRLRQQAGRHALVDGIPFTLPVATEGSPALMAAFPINADRAAELLPGNELHPIRIGRRALLLVSVIDYQQTNIGKYIEYSIGIGCTHGRRPAPLVLAALFRKHYGFGQFVVDLPVSTEISVKGGKGIWGMPKHQANLDFSIGPSTVRSRYDLDGRMVAEVEIARPRHEWLPVRAGAVNWCTFRGMLMKSNIYFRGKMGIRVGSEGSARFTLGDHPRADVLRRLEIGSQPLFTGFFPASAGVLDDHLECWFVSYAEPPVAAPEGFESVIDLGVSEAWLPPPGTNAHRYLVTSTHEGDPLTPETTLMTTAAPGITFRETMQGHFSLGATDPDQGNAAGEQAGTTLAMHVTVTVRDLDRFVADPDHNGSLVGTVDFAPLGMAMPAGDGVFRLFAPAAELGTTLMVYELPFRHEGKAYYLAGAKQIHDDPGFDLWSDTTTLYTRLFEGSDTTGSVIGAGVLRLDAGAFAKVAASVRAVDASSPVEAAALIAKFGGFFARELWKSYAATPSA